MDKLNIYEVEIESLSNEIQQKSIAIARMNAKIFSQGKTIDTLQKKLKPKSKNAKSKRA